MMRLRNTGPLNPVSSNAVYIFCYAAPAPGYMIIRLPRLILISTWHNKMFFFLKNFIVLFYIIYILLAHFTKNYC
jgi:hypothetical protein